MKKPASCCRKCVVIGFPFKLYTSGSGEKKKKSLVLLADPSVKYSLPLIEKEKINYDTRLFRFGLPTPDHVLGSPVGQFVLIIAKIGNDTIVRAYTPVTSDADHGYIDIVIKVYFKNVHPNFPEGGKLTPYLNNLKIGQTVDFRGPFGNLIYKGHGKFSIKISKEHPPVEYNVKKVVMLAGGTGIAPMLQLIRVIIRVATDETQTSLIFANQTEKDVILRNELDGIAKKYPNKLKLWYTVDTSSENWPYSTGHINADMIKEHMFPPSPDTIVLMCGPPPMINFACNPSLDKLGYDQKLRFTY